jgi:hypothetical protein
MKKVISFSLWGNDPRYTLGALQNASLARIVYPGWTCRFYIGRSTSNTIISLLECYDNVEVVTMQEDGDWTGMFWRFMAVADPEVDVCIVRDCDSRLWFRERQAVDEWLASDKDFHIMRDNPQHGTEILGGMWGARSGLLNNMKELIESYVKGDYWQVDQNFLRDVIYPLVFSNSFVHDEYFERKPFPGTRDPRHFVGQAYAGCGKILDQEHTFQEYILEYYVDV